MALGGINILVCGSLYFLAIDPARDRRPAAHAPDQSSPLLGRQAVAWALRRPVFWALLAALLAYAAAFSTLTFHLYPLLLERGLNATGVVTVMAVIGPAQVAGRVVIWAFAPTAPVRLVGSIIVIIFPLAVIGFAYAPPEILMIGVVAAFYGAANGMMTIVRGLAVPEMLSGQAYGSINGALVAPMHFVQAVAPLAAASVWAATGGYDAVLVATFAGAMVLAFAFWIAAALARPKELRNPPT
jgi:predicted MFS family arabinose efflux permease